MSSIDEIADDKLDKEINKHKFETYKELTTSFVLFIKCVIWCICGLMIFGAIWYSVSFVFEMWTDNPDKIASQKGIRTEIANYMISIIEFGFFFLLGKFSDKFFK
jgi:ABC-type phosphate transport system permease subunit